MAGSVDTKTKLLHLLDILNTQTDEDHPLDTAALIAALETRGIKAERKSIYRDLDVLRDFGFDIILSRGNPAGYFLADRKLQLAEIRLLMDAVLSAGFITRKKSTELIAKLQTLCSKHQGAQLDRQVYIDKRKKHKNEEIYYSIDVINQAVTAKRKITFDYARRVLNEEGKITLSTRRFTVSPYALLWFDDCYYVIGNNEKYDNLMHLRVDRMQRVQLTKEPCRSFEEVSPYRNSFDVADYAGKLGSAFGGQAMVMELLCDGNMLEQILDRFGEDIAIRGRPDGKFSFRVEMAISDGLVRELIGMGTGVQVLSPRVLRDKITQTVAELHQMYQES